MRRRLSDDEREIRKGTGIPIWKWWPFAAIFLTLLVVSFDHALFERCIGDPLEGRRLGGARLLLALPCSPLLLRGSPSEWLMFACIWIPVPPAVRCWTWAKRSNAYWHGVRWREAERRAQKRAKTIDQKDTFSDLERK